MSTHTVVQLTIHVAVFWQEPILAVFQTIYVGAEKA